MKILVTSGAMREMIDNIRCITNISSGALGSIISDIASEEHNVTCISTKHTFQPSCDKGNGMRIIEATSFTEVESALNIEVPKHDVIIHAMAVSDFSFNRPDNVKIHSKEDLIQCMKDNIKDNPKLLPLFRKWNPKAYIVGFKFEVGKTKEELALIAHKQIIRCDIDLTVANDIIEMNRTGSHIAYIVDKIMHVTECNGKYDIARQLMSRIKFDMR